MGDELASEYVHLDVLIVEATDERPVHHLVTSGMSSKPMHTEDEDDRLAELVIVLPREWPLGEEDWRRASPRRSISAGPAPSAAGASGSSSSARGV